MIGDQLIAVLILPILVAVMIPVFRLWRKAFPGRWRYGWFFGLATYWLT
jgi:hypothetical protein